MYRGNVIANYFFRKSNSTIPVFAFFKPFKKCREDTSKTDMLLWLTTNNERYFFSTTYCAAVIPEWFIHSVYCNFGKPIIGKSLTF